MSLGNFCHINAFPFVGGSHIQKEFGVRAQAATAIKPEAPLGRVIGPRLVKSPETAHTYYVWGTCGKCWAMYVWQHGAAHGKKAGVRTGKLGSGPEPPKTDCTTMKMGKSLKSTERQSLKWESKDKTWRQPKFNIGQWCKGKNQWIRKPKNGILFPALPISGFPVLGIWGPTSEPQFSQHLNELVDLTASQLCVVSGFSV